MAVRETGALLALGLLGGTWAAALGIRRATRPERTAMLDARTQIQVQLDALRSRTAELNRLHLSPGARLLVDRAVEDQVLIDAVLSRAASVDDVDELMPQIADALDAIEDAARDCGLDMPASNPFHGLCQIDPAHGAAHTTSAAVQLCEECAAAASSSNPRQVRQVTQLGRPVPFNEPRSRNEHSGSQVG